VDSTSGLLHLKLKVNTLVLVFFLTESITQGGSFFSLHRERLRACMFAANLVSVLLCFRHGLHARFCTKKTVVFFIFHLSLFGHDGHDTLRDNLQSTVLLDS
jgi:hypothetical protein